MPGIEQNAAVAYDEDLAERVRARVAAIDKVVELNMFGGWGVTVSGNMAVGVMDRDLIVRVGPEGFDAALERPGVRPFDFTGRPMTGWVFVAPDAIENARSLDAWVARGVQYAQSLPAKQPKKRSPPKTRATRSRKDR
jgi:TfoX/Sxy family transcriptional regulator of competence genes